MPRKVLKFKKKYATGLEEGIKTSTIRRNTNLKEGDIVDIMVGNDVIGTAKIFMVEKKKLKELTLSDAKMDGFKSLKDLKKALKRIYGRKITDETELYIIRFDFKSRD